MQIKFKVFLTLFRYTVYGGSKYAERGLIPRMICELFARLREKGNKFRVSVKCLEVYNDQGYDLLDQEQREILKVDLFRSIPNL